MYVLYSFLILCQCINRIMDVVHGYEKMFWDPVDRKYFRRCSTNLNSLHYYFLSALCRVVCSIARYLVEYRYVYFIRRNKTYKLHWRTWTELLMWPVRTLKEYSKVGIWTNKIWMINEKYIWRTEASTNAENWQRAKNGKIVR